MNVKRLSLLAVTILAFAGPIAALGDETGARDGEIWQALQP